MISSGSSLFSAYQTSASMHNDHCSLGKSKGTIFLITFKIGHSGSNRIIGKRLFQRDCLNSRCSLNPLNTVLIWISDSKFFGKVRSESELQKVKSVSSGASWCSPSPNVWNGLLCFPDFHFTEFSWSFSLLFGIGYFSYSILLHRRM